MEHSVNSVPGHVKDIVTTTLNIISSTRSDKDFDTGDIADQSIPIGSRLPAALVGVRFIRDYKAEVIQEDTGEGLTDIHRDFTEFFGPTIAELELNTNPVTAITIAALGGFVVDTDTNLALRTTEDNGNAFRGIASHRMVDVSLTEKANPALLQSVLFDLLYI